MWVKIVKTVICGTFLVLMEMPLLECHIPSYLSTPSNKIEQYCSLSESCVHDTIAVCGRMGDEKRTFLDLCDMLEYACDTDLIYTHIDDEVGCPKEKTRP